MRRWKSGLGSLALLGCSCAIAFCISEMVFRARYGHYFYGASKEVQAIQAFLQTDPELGFTWKPGITEDLRVILEVKDAELPPLSTDDSGFLNHPQAIAQAREGITSDVIGLGDSFVEHASHTFFVRLKEAGFHYYGRAIHRQAPPQYNLILARHALPAKPRWIVYGLYENDFWETRDYQQWQESGLDWFTFHSGTWCGRPLSVGAARRFFGKHLRGFGAFTQVINERLGRTSASTDKAPNADLVLPYLCDAHARAEVAGCRFLLLLIPSKKTTLDKATPESAAFDALLPPLGEEQIEVLDLRAPFAEAPEPAALFYERDGHWNANGMNLAADLILERIQRAPRDVR